MKKIIIFFTIIFPFAVNGQLFPKIPDFKGNIQKVVEKSYGKDIYLFHRYLYLPNMYSGWKKEYYFDKNSNLINQKNKYNGKTRADYKFQKEIINNKILEKEIIQDNVNNERGNYIEYEYILDNDGRINKLNLWSYQSKNNTTKLSIIERNTEYKNGKLISYTREYINTKGDTLNGELYKLEYDAQNKLMTIEEWSNGVNYKGKKINDEKFGEMTEYGIDKEDTISKLIKKYTFIYNLKHQINIFKLEYLEENETNKTQTNYFKYDSNNNWIKMFRQFDNGKKRLIAKRKIKYR